MTNKTYTGQPGSGLSYIDMQEDMEMTNKTKWTSGPWVIEQNSFDTFHMKAISSADHGELASVVWLMEDDRIDGKKSEQCEANAHLIAAAPELYDALSKALELMLETRTPSNHSVVIESGRVLAKARGES